MAEKEKHPLSGLSEEELEVYYETNRVFLELQEDEKEFINWVIDGASNKRLDVKKTGLQKLLEMYEQETGKLLNRLKG